MEQKNYCKGCRNLIQYTTNKDYCIFCQSEEFSKIYSSHFDYTLKILLLGDPFSGKEELLRKYSLGYFQENQKLTIGIDFYSKNITLKDKIIKIQLWDVDWEKRFRFLLPSFVKGANGAIIMYDITNSNSLKHMPEWILIIREHGGDIPIILTGNKLDLEISREVSREEGIKIAEKHNLSAFIEISTKTGENVEKLFEILTKIIINQFYHN